MKLYKPQINLSFPAKMLSFSEKGAASATESTTVDSVGSANSSDERFSRGKLAVFYKGETADHRYFSDEFSEQLLKSLPYTPIVSYYDSKKKDFQGHAAHQAIYGIVDPKGEISFQKGEDGNTWAVCDVVYYTERPDEVGEIAKQISGHAQSLELADAKYIINYDERRHFKNIEFTAGKFVGVSVLGEDQKPAFPGAAFFEEGGSNDQFTEKMKTLRDYVDGKLGVTGGQPQQVTEGGQMKITTYSDFRKLTWGEISSKVDEAISKEYAEEDFTQLVDLDGEYAYVVRYSYIDGSTSYQRIAYSVNEDGSVTLGEVKTVHRTWEVVENDNTSKDENVQHSSDTEAKAETEVKAEASTEVNANAEDGSHATESAAVEKPSEEKTLETASNTEEKLEVNNDNTNNIQADASMQQQATEEKTSDSASLASSEKEQPERTDSEGEKSIEPTEQSAAAEKQEQMSVTTETATDSIKPANSASLTAAPEEEKVTTSVNVADLQALLFSYKDKISEEDYDEFAKKLSSYSSVSDLEVDLLKSYINKEQESQKGMRRVFAFTPAVNNNGANGSDNRDDEEWIRNSLHR